MTDKILTAKREIADSNKEIEMDALIIDRVNQHMLHCIKHNQMVSQNIEVLEKKELLENGKEVK